MGRLGLVGETASGKSTVAQMLGGIVKPSAGRITFQGKPFNGDLIRRERGIQLVMQDPLSSTSHRFTVGQTLREPLEINKVGSRAERESRVF
ncbi:MAG: ATP-binding cassette domain-containing protein [Bacillota bacterium]